MGFLKKIFGSTPQTPAAPAASALAASAPAKETMYTVKPDLTHDPFAKINYWNLPNGGKRVRAYLLMQQGVEGAQTGVAIDGSGSMIANFGLPYVRQLRLVNQQDQDYLRRQGINDVNDPRARQPLIQRGVLQEMPAGQNVVEDQARNMTAYLSTFDGDGGTTVIYWAVGDGKQIEVMGDLTREQCPSAKFAGPTRFGTATHLLPAIQYFVNRFQDAKWGMYVFITDGQIMDLEDVKKYCTWLAHEIEAKRRNELKFVLIGVGNEINEQQMEELDDLDTGTDVDLWDHKIAREMHQLAEIFAEVVSESMIVVPGMGVIRGSDNAVIKDFRDSGLPALMVFELPAGCNSFSLEIGENKVVQALTA